MTVALDIPDEIAAQLAPSCQELSRTAREAPALEAFGRGALTQIQVGQLLGMPRLQTEDFLAQHLDLYDYSPDELGGKSRLWRNSLILRPARDGRFRHLTATRSGI